MSAIDEIKYDDGGLVPAVVQQHDSGEVLMVAWMNAESLRRTLETGTTWFWSRSRNKLWHKGETSGNFLRVREVYKDCDNDTILVKAMPVGPVCHTGKPTCFFEKLR